ncbi:MULTISPECIES: CoA transferase [Ramlibacter]|uniref:CoA transferase n=1 Tax=Ramlibacter pinisoli TaxID=2682844 RepID=A0A6N8IMR1_9BURK|nr:MULTISPECIES: CoA transferase [Ramlibacter]MBA2963152.1 CoA transferase [Ramlibacter sp. CGMCC 1.13660]MVQ28121.1 CoA transferase [Ramlibacter pinisoli]
MAALPPPLAQVRIVSLALNLPGPAALMRCRRFGATCVKVEPPAGDPMRSYNPAAYAELHEGIQVRSADLKAPEGQAALHKELARADILLTSFRPSALKKLGLEWAQLHSRYPSLCHVAIVGAPGAGAEVPGHDLTYVAEQGLVNGTDLPATLFADMAGSLMASEAVFQAALLQAERYAGTGDNHPVGRYLEVALSEAARYLALPRHWGLTQPSGAVGGAHAGYRVYRCKDGRVAVAALEPHFAAALGTAAEIEAPSLEAMAAPATHAAIAAFFARRTRAELDRLAAEKDIPLHTLAD